MSIWQNTNTWPFLPVLAFTPLKLSKQEYIGMGINGAAPPPSQWGDLRAKAKALFKSGIFIKNNAVPHVVQEGRHAVDMR